MATIEPCGGYCFETPYRPIWCDERPGYVDEQAEECADDGAPECERQGSEVRRAS